MASLQLLNKNHSQQYTKKRLSQARNCIAHLRIAQVFSNSQCTVWYVLNERSHRGANTL